MQDPISLLTSLYPYNPEKILAAARGESYTAIMLANGKIGVCSNLGNKAEADPMELTIADPGIPDQRVLALAYANANVNYGQEYPIQGDIFDLVDFTAKKHIVMIGYFPPLVEKFRQKGIPLTVFDQHQNYPGLSPIGQINEEAEKTDCMIMSSTTLINNTFTGLVAKVKPGTEIHLLGPSTPLLPQVKEKYRLSSLFGMIFRPFDFEILGLIGKGAGTQVFGKKGKKVSL
jgi:uncharacterized protein (DUF4213/DUF364 family)